MSARTELEAFWEQRYSGGRTWSGRPNRLLVDEVAGLPPGTALDLGCGEGGDALWLAQQGWRVTAVDVSANALELAAAHVAAADPGLAVTWERHDLGASFPAGSFDLVSACFLHSPVEIPRGAILRRAADAVAPGGTLLVVGHAGSPSWADAVNPVHLPTPEEVRTDLDLELDAWEVVRSATVTVACPDPDGGPGTRPDNVLRLRRAG